MTTKDTLFKNIEKSIISLPTNKRTVSYFFDKTILKSWIKDDTKNTCYVRIFMDFMFYIKAKFKDTNNIIPIDVLMELKDDSEDFVTKKSFKRWINFLARIMIVDPDVKLSHSEAVSKIAGVFNKAGYRSCIITLNKELYKKDEERGILVVIPHEILITLMIYYGIGPIQFKSIVDEWLEDNLEEKDVEELTDNKE